MNKLGLTSFGANKLGAKFSETAGRHKLELLPRSRIGRGQCSNATHKGCKRVWLTRIEAVANLVAGAVVRAVVSLGAIVRRPVRVTSVAVVVAAASVVVRLVVVVVVVPHVNSVAAVLVVPFDLSLEMGPLAVLVALNGMVGISAPVTEVPSVRIWNACVPLEVRIRITTGKKYIINILHQTPPADRKRST